MNCEEVRVAMLAGDRGPAVDAHRRGCPACQRAELGLEMLRRQLEDPALWEQPAADLAERVARAVQAAAGAGRTPAGEGASAPAHPSAPRSRRAAGAGRRRWSWSSGWAVAAMGGAFAAVVAVIAILVAGAGSGPRPDFEVELAGTRSAPAASATVYGWNEAAGTRLELDVDGLPPSGPDAYYAVWMTSPDGRHVPAGTFRSSGTVWAWSGVTEAEFPRLWVTLEPNDGDEALSGATVLDTAQPS